MDLTGSQGMHQGQTSAAKSKSVNPFETNNWEMTFNVKLFMYANAQGLKIYKDPMGRYVVKKGDILSVFNKAPWVNYQEDLYMGVDGAFYEVTKHLELVDVMGVLASGQKDPRNTLHLDLTSLKLQDEPFHWLTLP